MHLVLNDSQSKLSDFLAGICPEGDDSAHTTTGQYPFPDHHWINKPLGTTYQCKTLLHLAMEKNVDLTQILLRGGAKADAYNDILGKCPIHVAAELESTDLIKVLSQGQVFGNTAGAPSACKTRWFSMVFNYFWSGPRT